MKTSKSNRTEIEIITRKCLYFRFGTDTPDEENFSKPIIPVTDISKMLRVPTQRLFYLIRKY